MPRQKSYTLKYTLNQVVQPSCVQLNNMNLLNLLSAINFRNNLFSSRAINRLSNLIQRIFHLVFGDFFIILLEVYFKSL